METEQQVQTPSSPEARNRLQKMFDRLPKEWKKLFIIASCSGTALLSIISCVGIRYVVLSGNDYDSGHKNAASITPTLTASPTDSPEAISTAIDAAVTATATPTSTSTATPTNQIFPTATRQSNQEATPTPFSVPVNKDEGPNLSFNSVPMEAGIRAYFEAELKSPVAENLLKDLIFEEPTDGQIHYGINQEFDLDTSRLGFNDLNYNQLQELFQNAENIEKCLVETEDGGYTIDLTQLKNCPALTELDGSNVFAFKAKDLLQAQAYLNLVIAQQLNRDNGLAVEENLDEANIVVNNLNDTFWWKTGYRQALAKNSDGTEIRIGTYDNFYSELAQTCRIEMAPDNKEPDYGDRADQEPTRQIVNILWQKDNDNDFPTSIDGKTAIFVIGRIDTTTEGRIEDRTKVLLVASDSPANNIANNYEVTSLTENDLTHPEGFTFDRCVEVIKFTPTATPLPMNEIVVEEAPPSNPVSTPVPPTATPNFEQFKSPNEDSNGDGGYENNLLDRDEPLDEEVEEPVELSTAPPAIATPLKDW